MKAFKTVLLLALPASGKSEVRNLMAHRDKKVLEEDFHIGENLQLDDFPYVNYRRRIDQELAKIGESRIYYKGDEDTFFDGRDWGTLIHRLNEDYHDLLNRNFVKTDSAAEYLFERLDRCSVMVGLKPRLSLLDKKVRKTVAEKLEKEAENIIKEKESQIPESFEDKTIVIEAARGGKDGSKLPLQGTRGYQYSLKEFAPDLLQDAAILYIWVTPEESRRKNFARANPNDPGSNLFHGVPLTVRRNEYGVDDREYLRNSSEVKNTITIISQGKKFHLPIGVFDNRVDRTSFLRQDSKDWEKSEVDAVTKSIKEATDIRWKNYNK